MPIYNIIKNNIVDIVWNKLNKVTPSTYSPDEAIATSMLGTPVYSNLEIKNGQWQDVVTGEIHKYSGLRFDAIAMQASQSKSLIETPIQGRNGTIKELICNEDYQIQIAGTLMSGLINVAPLEEKAVLSKICTAQCDVEVVSQFLNDLGIFNIVIKSWTIQEVTGSRDTFQFSINAVSQTPFDLEVVLEEEQN